VNIFLSILPRSGGPGLWRQNWALLLVVLLSTSCETIVDIDYPDTPPEITVNSIFHPQSTFEVHLSEARSVRDRGEPPNITNATVDIYKNGERIETLQHADNGLYRSPYTRPVAGSTYEVRISAPGYEFASATDYVPQSVPLEFVYDSRQSKQSRILKAKIRLQDPPDVENYYRLMVTYQYGGPNNLMMNLLGFHTDDDAIVTENVDPFEDGSDDSSYFDSAFFSDQYLESGTHEIRLEVHAPEWVNGWFVSLEINLDVISKSFYDYATTYRKFETFRDNPFKEPVLVSNNVRNGFGLFAGFNSERFDVAF